jgi:hypothetical protein
VDTGSTHTFIRDDLLPQLDLILTPRNGLTVKVANGEQVTSGGVCRTADLEIGTEHFSANLYALSLDVSISSWEFSGCAPWARSCETSTC